MTTDTGVRASASGLARPEIRPTGLLRQSLSIVRRNLIHIKRMPEMLMDVTVQPVMFVLLFAFVFGGSISVQGSPAGYREWLMGGIMGQTIAFASFIVAVAARRISTLLFKSAGPVSSDESGWWLLFGGSGGTPWPSSSRREDAAWNASATVS